MSTYAINYDAKTVHIVGDTAQFNRDRRLVNLVNKIRTNPVTGIGFVSQGMAQMAQCFEMWIETDPTSDVKTIEDVVDRAPAFLQGLQDDFVGDPEEDDDHQVFFVWGPDRTGSFRLYALSSYDGFEPTPKPAGTYLVPETADDELPAKLKEPAADLTRVVKQLHIWCTERDGISSGGPLLYFQQNANGQMICPVGNLDEEKGVQVGQVSAPAANRQQKRAAEKRARKAARRKLH